MILSASCRPRPLEGPRLFVVALLSSLLLTATLAAQALPLPPRPASALTGSQILPLIANVPVADREAFVLQEVAAGNVPSFLRQLVPITTTRVVGGIPRTATYWVTPDYLAVGSDADFFRMPMTPTLAQQIADHLGCALPTRRMVDTIHARATVRLAPSFFHPATYDILSPAIFHQHHLRIEAQRGSTPLGLLVSGIKKDVVISPLIASWPGRVVIYGWHQLNGQPIQPLSKVHFDGYADYSHGIRLVQGAMTVDGQATDVATVLADPARAPLLSDEGAFTSSRYPVPPPPASFPLFDPFPLTGPALASWTPRFTPPQTIYMQPFAPTGDGLVIKVHDPAGGTDSIRLGGLATTDCVVQADIYCEFRPQLASNGYERLGIFARDNAGGAFDGTFATPGACYGLTWDSDDGRLRCMKAAGGRVLDLAPSPIHRPSTAWRRFRIEARGADLRFLVDGELLLQTTDTSYPRGAFGIGYHENFASNLHMRGTRADNFFADRPDALTTRLAPDPATGGFLLESTHGVPGDLCFRGLSFTAGAFPNAPFFGIDLSIADALLLYASGHPSVVGVFDAAGVHAHLHPPPLPSGLTVHAVTLDFGPSGRLLGISPPTSAVVP